MISILIISANPIDEGQPDHVPLAVDEEVRAVTAALRGSPGRDLANLKTAWAARPRDLLVELNESQPVVLHFSGHGMHDGRLVFVDDLRSDSPVSGSAIASTLASAGESVRVVVLNACYSAELTDDILDHVEIVVAMSRPIGDDAAAVFAQAFYSALGYGKSVANAVAQGRAALRLDNYPDHDVPQLAHRDDVDPDALILIDLNADINALKRATSEHLAHLLPHATLPVRSGLELPRLLHEALNEEAESGSLFLIGPPGAGKTGSLHRFATDAITAGRDVVVLAADLLEATGQRGLRDQLGLRVDVADVLAAWPGNEPGFLIIDALDAARGVEAASALLRVVERLGETGGRWHVIASIRSFDLRHSPELRDAIPARGRAEYTDPEFISVGHIAVTSLTDSELAILEDSAPTLHAFFDAASPTLRELLRVPFNLRLLAGLLDREETNPDQIRAVNTQLELLDLYWERRVLAPAVGSDGRELLATRVCEVAIEIMRLQVPRATVRERAATLTQQFDELLADGVLVEARTAGSRQNTVGYAHHILFDYAVHRLLLSGEPPEVVERLMGSEDLVLLARPSLVFTLATAWESSDSRSGFWDLVLCLTDTKLPMMARLVGPTMAAERAMHVDDFGPLVAAIDRREELAQNALRYLVSARTAQGSTSRPLENSDLALWSKLAVTLSERTAPETVYPLRLLVWGLASESESLSVQEMDALGRSSRALLTWAWGQDPVPKAELTVALEAVARSCSSDPAAAEALLSRTLEPERLPIFGHTELREIVEELEAISSCMPTFAARLFEGVFGHDEQSDEPTEFGSGQILALSSTRRQDWQSLQYSLAQGYPAVLLAAPGSATRGLAAACVNEANRYSSLDQNRVARFQFLDRTSGAIPDRSANWDSSGLARDAGTMLDAFERAVGGESDGVQPSEEILDAIAGRDLPAAIWRRVFKAAAKDPARLAPKLVSVLESSEVLTSLDLRGPICELLRVGSAHWDIAAQARIESSIGSIPDRHYTDRPEVALHVRDTLLGCLSQATSETERAESSGGGLEDPSARILSEVDVDLEDRWSRNDDNDEPEGFDRANGADRALADLVKPVAAFARTHLNEVPTSDAVLLVLQNIIELRDAHARLQEEASESALDHSRAWLSDVSFTLAKQTPLPVDDASVAIARELAIAGVSGALPKPMALGVEEFDRTGPHWGVPSGRSDAARALLLLCRAPQTADNDVFGAIERLATDHHPGVRWVVARELGHAYATQRERAWRLVTTMAEREPSAHVRLALLHPLATFGTDRLDDVLTLVRRLHDSEGEWRQHEALTESLTEFLMQYWIWRGSSPGRALIDEWLTDIGQHASRAVGLFYTLRQTVTHGQMDDDDSRAVRQRAIAAWIDVTQAARDAFDELIASTHETETVSPHAQAIATDLRKLLDRSASELYFGSGAYEERQHNEQERLSRDVRRRFYREGADIIDVLVPVGIPSAAHHVIETLSSFVDDDPRGVLVRIGKVLNAAQAWGYQFESLAVSEIMKLAHRYIATHRDLLIRDRETRRILISAIEGFVEVGSPEARNLLYGLDDMFR